MTTQEGTVRIWQVLIAAAHHRQTVTEEEVAKLIGQPGDRLGAPRDLLARYCTERQWPSLDALIVSGKAGAAAEGSDSEAGAIRERAFSHPWFSLSPPAMNGDDADPQPAKRRCPHCGKAGNAAATLCGYCWERLTPELAPSAHDL